MIHLDDFPGHINIDDNTFFLVPLVLLISSSLKCDTHCSESSEIVKEEGVKYGEIESFLCLQQQQC